MNQDIAMPAKPKKLYTFLNILLMLYNALMAYTLCVIIIVSRRLHIDPFLDSQGVYPGSRIFAFLLRKELFIVPVILMTWMIIKEFRIQLLRKRVYVNLIILAAIHLHLFLTMLLPHIYT